MMMLLMMLLMMGMITTCPALTTNRVGFSLRSSGPAPPLRSLFVSSFQHHHHYFHDASKLCSFLISKLVAFLFFKIDHLRVIFMGFNSDLQSIFPFPNHSKTMSVCVGGREGGE